MGNKGVLKIIEDTFKCYYRPLNLYAIHYLKDLDEAEDVVQECFADLWERLNSNKPVSDIKSYLYRMVRNKCIDHLREEMSVMRDVLPVDLDSIVSDDESEKTSRIEARLWTAIDNLPERCREIFLLNKCDGLKYQEVADKMGLSIHTVDNQISKALRLLRNKADKIYYFVFS